MAGSYHMLSRPSGINDAYHKLGAMPLRQRILSGMDYPGDRDYVYEANLKNSRLCIVSGSCWGGPQVAQLVEELAYFSVKFVIGYGAAGSLSSELPKNSQIVAVQGLITDGTSRAYTKAKSVNADPELVEMLISIKSKLKHDVLPATIATVDAIYQETDKVVQKWCKLGATAINMETTPFYAASNHCGLKSIWLGYVSDCLFAKKWDTWWNAPETMDEETAEITAVLVKTLVASLK